MEDNAPAGQTPRLGLPAWGRSVLLLVLLGVIFLLSAWVWGVAQAYIFFKVGLASGVWVWGGVLARQQKGRLALGALASGLPMLVSGALDTQYLTLIAPLPAETAYYLERLPDIERASTALFYLGVGLLNLVFLGQLFAQRLPPEEFHRRRLVPLVWLILCAVYVRHGLGDLWSLGRWFWGF